MRGEHGTHHSWPLAPSSLGLSLGLLTIFCSVFLKLRGGLPDGLGERRASFVAVVT